MSKVEKESYILAECKKSFNEKIFVNQAMDLLNIMPELDKSDAIDEILNFLKMKYIELMKKIEQAKVNTEGIDKNNSVQKQEINSAIQVERMLITTLLKILSPFSVHNKYKDETLIKYYKIFVESINSKKYIGPVTIVWLIGTDNIDKNEDKMLSKIMENCTNNNELYILAGSNPENLEMSFRCCNYLFINSPDERLYTKYKISFTKKSDDNKTMDFKIINYNQERSYKQFSYECKSEDAPKLDFEEIEI